MWNLPQMFLFGLLRGSLCKMRSDLPCRGVVTVGWSLASLLTSSISNYSQVSILRGSCKFGAHRCTLRLRLLLPTHITLCLFELSFICLQAAQSPKVFPCIWNFSQISLVFISQNNLEPVEISGKRLSDNYVTIAHVISDQVAEAGPAGVPGRRALLLAGPCLELSPGKAPGSPSWCLLLRVGYVDVCASTRA